MHLLATTRIAFRALRKNKMRAGLTVLGVVIGSIVIALFLPLIKLLEGLSK